VEFQPYTNIVESVYEAKKADRKVLQHFKYEKNKLYYASKVIPNTCPTS
jgi:hypothetical protein